MMTCTFACRGLATGKGAKTKGPPGQQKMPELADYVKVPTARAGKCTIRGRAAFVVRTKPSIPDSVRVFRWRKSCVGNRSFRFCSNLVHESKEVSMHPDVKPQ